MGKVGKEYDSWFLFDEKIILNFSGNDLCLYYQIDDCYCFLSFSPETKEFVERHGFGRNYKNANPKWWKDPGLVWKEISE